MTQRQLQICAGLVPPDVVVRYIRDGEFATARSDSWRFDWRRTHAGALEGFYYWYAFLPETPPVDEEAEGPFETECAARADAEAGIVSVCGHAVPVFRSPRGPLA
jgi:hypothetical protein